MGGRTVARCALIAGALSMLLLFAAGCGDDGARERAAAAPVVKRDRFTYARGLFHEMCAGCHTLKDAGATGRQSNLDTSILSRQNRDERLTIVRVAMAEDPTTGGGFMPKWKGVLTDRDWNALVTYVVEVTGSDGG